MGVKEAVISVLACLFLLATGLACLIWTDGLRDYALRMSGKSLARFNPFLNWMRTPEYIWSLRAIGILAIGAFIVIVVTVVKNIGSTGLPR